VKRLLFWPIWLVDSTIKSTRQTFDQNLCKLTTAEHLNSHAKVVADVLRYRDDSDDLSPLAPAIRRDVSGGDLEEPDPCICGYLSQGMTSLDLFIDGP